MTMKTARVSELLGFPLDWAVALAQGFDYSLQMPPPGDGYSPSTNWAQGGPVLESLEATASYSPYDHVEYGKGRPWMVEKEGKIQWGETLLVAAMRLHVRLHLGDEVQIPDDLLKSY